MSTEAGAAIEAIDELTIATPSELGSASDDAACTAGNTETTNGCAFGDATAASTEGPDSSRTFGDTTMVGNGADSDTVLVSTQTSAVELSLLASTAEVKAITHVGAIGDNNDCLLSSLIRLSIRRAFISATRRCPSRIARYASLPTLRCAGIPRLASASTPENIAGESLWDNVAAAILTAASVMPKPEKDTPRDRAVVGRVELASNNKRAGLRGKGGTAKSGSDLVRGKDGRSLSTADA
jgi:hypothetical protein